MNSLYFFPKNQFCLHFFLLINKDHNFFIHYYENQEVKPTSKSVASVAMLENTGISAFFSVALKISTLQLKNSNQI
jgi:hypothetical protein